MKLENIRREIDIRHTLGLTLRPYNRNKLREDSAEDFKHFIVKATIFKILRDRGRTVVTEAQLKTNPEIFKTESGVHVADVFDVDNLIIYEVEGKMSNSKINIKLDQFRSEDINDIVIIDLKNVPNDINRMRKYLERAVV